jgi:hypothetical protein
MMKVAVLAFFSWPISFSSITTSATQPFGTGAAKPKIPLTKTMLR